MKKSTMIVMVVAMALATSSCDLQDEFFESSGGWKINTNKEAVDALRGKDGQNGEDGVNGAPGQDGKDGRDGEDGRDGRDGKDGRDGRDGKDGQDGRDGKDGQDGRDGKDAIVDTDTDTDADTDDTDTDDTDPEDTDTDDTDTDDSDPEDTDPIDEDECNEGNDFYCPPGHVCQDGVCISYGQCIYPWDCSEGEACVLTKEEEVLVSGFCAPVEDIITVGDQMLCWDSSGEQFDMRPNMGPESVSIFEGTCAEHSFRGVRTWWSPEKFNWSAKSNNSLLPDETPTCNSYPRYRGTDAPEIILECQVVGAGSSFLPSRPKPVWWGDYLHKVSGQRWQ